MSTDIRFDGQVVIVTGAGGGLGRSHALDFAAVVEVHLMGAVKPLKALWEIMRAQNYGRVVLTTSSTGLYGNFGQSNYGAAKLALVGLMNTLELEGAKNDIRVNAISPVAATRVTDALMPPEMLARLAPEHVTPGVVYLASQEAPNGAILTAGAGVFSLAQVVETVSAQVQRGGSARPMGRHLRPGWRRGICGKDGSDP